MADFNPNTTATKGLEWFPVTESSITLDAATKSACQSIIQSASQATGTARVWLGSLPTRGGVYVLEVYDNETGVASNFASTAFQPNEDVSGTGAALWREDDNTTTTIFSEIDETTASDADYIYTQADGNVYAGRVNTATTLNGKRILGVKLMVRCTGNAPLGGFSSLGFGLSIGGVSYGASTTGLFSSARSLTNYMEISETWLYNPSTKRPWLAADIAALDVSDEFELYAGIQGGGQVRVSQVVMTVYYCDENRLALGNLDDSGSALTANAWNAITLITPTSGTWTKDGAGRHLYSLRRISTGGSIVVPTLAGPALPNPATGYLPTLDPTYFYMTAMGSSQLAVFGLIQRTTAPAESVDSQPYVDALEALVFTGQDAEQEFSAAAATSYGAIRARVKPNGSTSNLSVKVKRRSDNLQFGSTMTITPAEAAAMVDAGSGWRTLEQTLSVAATLATGTQYYIEFSSTAAGTGTDYWSVLALDTGDQGNGATLGGTTDRAVVNAVEADRYDLPVTLGSVVTTPAGFATTDSYQSVGGDGSGCTASLIHNVRLAWTATALGGLFDQYEIERSVSGGDWVRVAEIGTEATVSWNDYESPRSLTACYRIRAVRLDGAASNWSGSTCKTPLPRNCEWTFTSNDDPTLNMALSQDGYEMAYEFLDADDVEVLEAYLRDYQIVIAGTETRGVAFDLPVFVRVAQPATTKGVAVFTALRALQDADIPYVCVMDAYGNRFFADIRVPTGDANTLAHFYLASIRVTEVRGEPYVDSA